jgi:hypothetical protein
MRAIDSFHQETAARWRTKRVQRLRGCPQSRQSGDSFANRIEKVGDARALTRLSVNRRRKSCERAAPAIAGQVAAGFFGFLDFRALLLTGFREDAGRMVSGRPAATGVTTGARSGSRKYARQPGLSWDLFLTMQAVMLSTSGM